MKLVAQGPSMGQAAAAQLGKLLGVDGERLSATAYRFPGAEQSQSVLAWCAERRIDAAFLPERRFADLRLVAMDMDSTLITMETIDELGACVGKKPQIAAITAQAMRGEIDYQESLRRRVRLLAGMDEGALEGVYRDKLRLTQGAETLIAACKKHGVRLLLVSGGFTFFVERLQKQLGIDYSVSNRLAIRGGRLTGELVGDIVDAEGKAAKFRAVCAELGARKEQTVAIGDGANDLRMMAEAGTSVAFRAKPVVRAQAACALTWSGLDGVLNLFD